MGGKIDLDRRKPRPSNHVFEAHNDHDPTQERFLSVFRDEQDTGVHLNIVEDRREPGGALHVHHFQWLSAAQCREFGEALIAVADQAPAITFRQMV